MRDRLVCSRGGAAHSDSLLQAQVKAFSVQIPILYLILIVNTVSLAATHIGAAPWPLVVLAPAAFVTVCVLRGLTWLRQKALDADAARVALSRTTVLGGVIGGAYLAWTMALFGYGDAYQQGHVVVSNGLTVVGCIFCLMHVRKAAFVIAAVIVIPFTIFLLFQEQRVLVALAIDLAGVSAVMIYMLNVHSRNFAEMIEAKTETDRLSSENHTLASTDSLTELPNRRSFFARLDQLNAPGGAAGRFVVGVIDLDGFKPVNDLYGHLVGDAVLVEAGARLKAVAGGHVFAGRLGGDEFAVILETAPDDAAAIAFGNRMCEALEAPYLALGVAVRISASIGFVASCQGGGGAAALLYERADYALFYAKQNRRGRAVMFSEEHETAIRRTGAIEQCLRNADLSAEMALVFQPIVTVETGRVVMLEALARWTSPELGSVPPNEFIPIAERTDLIHRITQTLLKQALDQAESWPDDVQVSFNLSARDLLPDGILRIIGILERSGVSPTRIVFEITETAAMRDIALAERSLAALRALGAHVALDDFGAGHSSLNYVRRLPLDKLKIDREFVTDIDCEGRCRDVMRSMIDLCRNLSIGCVAEGVETERQRDILLSLGCTTMQGYLFSLPLPPARVQDFLEGAGAMEARNGRGEALRAMAG